MNKEKIKELLNEILEKWLTTEQNYISEMSFGYIAKREFENVQKIRNEYKTKIEMLLNYEG